MNRQRLLKTLQEDTTWIAVKNGKDEVSVAKQFGKKKPKVIKFILICSREGIHLKHPNYEFKSTVSHFCAIQKDVRLSLNKTFLTSIIKSLKNLGLWELIINKDFLQINKNNAKSDKGLVGKELKNLLR